MKKVFYSFITIFLLSCCFFLVGCGPRYSNLVMTSQLSFSQESSTLLENGAQRVSTSSGTFDVNPDGSYTFYIKDALSSTANLDILFENTPANFNFGAAFNISNAVVKVSANYEYILGGIRTQLTATAAGQAEVNVLSLEGNKSTTIRVTVKQVAQSISFKDNKLALTNERNSFVDLSNQVLCQSQSAFLGDDFVSYEFGRVEGEEFVKYTDSELVSFGLSFNASTKRLTVISGGGTQLNNLVVKAIYNSPLGDNLSALSNVRVVSTISDFELFKGNQRSDAVEENKITDVQEFVVNFDTLNSKDIILKVRSNGEKPTFSFLESELMPFEIISQPNTSMEYTNEDGSRTYSSYESATFAYVFLRLVASSSTVNALYPQNIFTLQFICDYADFSVSGYPLVQNYQAKNLSLIKNFSINNSTMESISAGDLEFKNNSSTYLEDCYTQTLYIDTDETIIGSPFKVGVSNPYNISETDANFTLEFYDSASQLHDSPLDVFSISYKSKNTTKHLTEMGVEFNLGTILYIKLNSTSSVSFQAGHVYYIVLRAVKPNISSQAVATIRIVIAQGIKEISSFDYSYLSYQVNSENGEFVLNENGEKVLGPEETGQIAFINRTASTDLNLDLENNVNTYISFNCLPLDASLDNLTLVSKDAKVLAVMKGGDNQYFLSTLTVGSTTIEISASNLTEKYTLKVNVYRPIARLMVTLMQTSAENGVGRYLQDENGNVTAAFVKANQNFSFKVATLPSNVTQYALSYTVKRNFSGSSLQIGNSYYKDAFGDTTGDSVIEDAGSFRLNCENKTFLFMNTQTSPYSYTIIISLININGVILTHEFTLQSYLNVENMSIVLPVTTVYDPNTVCFEDKIDSFSDLTLNESNQPTNDSSVFGVAVTAFARENSAPTYSFLSDGKLVFMINGVRDSEYSCYDGVLTKTFSIVTSAVTLLQNVRWEGLFWFKLNENYNFSSVSTIVLNTFIKELDYYVSRDRKISVLSATASTGIFVNLDSVSDNNYELNFKKGLSSEQNIVLQLQSDKTHNKKLSYMVLNQKIIDDNDRFVLAEQGFGLSDVSIISTGIEAQYSLNIKINPSQLSTAYVIILPQDKLLTGSQFDAWNSFSYLSVTLDEDSFEQGLYFVLQSDTYVLAENFSQSAEYFVRVKTNLSSVLGIWTKTLVFKIEVADGVDSPYYISSLEELKQICANEESSSKSYILTKDITLTSDWEMLGANFYVADVSGTLADDDYYIFSNGRYVVVDMLMEFDPAQTYYRTGFHGTLSGKHIVRNIEGDILSTNLHSLLNVTYSATTASDTFGIIAKLGKTGSVENLTVNYSSFQPTLAGEGAFFTFGGMVGINYGTLKNVLVNFSQTYLKANKNLSFGGLVGKNYGVIIQNDSAPSGVRGSVNFTLFSADYEYNIGGLVGENYQIISGKYSLSQKIDYSFGDTSFDSSLIINVSTASAFVAISSNIGGIAGVNQGKISSVSVQGKIIAPFCDNVGGLVGVQKYNENFNGEKAIESEGGINFFTAYSLKDAYSIVIIKANDFVGGAVGKVLGESQKIVFLYNVSAENYSSGNTARTLVSARNVVGGLIGSAEFLNVSFSYFISYFNCVSITTNVLENYNYDVVGENQVAGFIGEFSNTTISECATNLSLRAQTQNASLFVVQTVMDESSLRNVFAIGSLYSQEGKMTLGFDSGVDGFSYSRVFDVVNQENVYFCQNNPVTSDALIISAFNNGSFAEMWNIDAAANINSGLPYLQILEESTGVQQALFASSSIIISANVKGEDAGIYEKFIKNNDNSFVLFLNVDQYNNYDSAKISLLNIIDIPDILDLVVYPQTSKTSRIEVFSNNEQVIKTNANGQLIIVGIGSAKITFMSKLNATIIKEIFVQVILGISDIEIFANVGLTSALDNAEINILKTISQKLYLQTEYQIISSSTESLNLGSCSNVGVRFIVQKEDFANLDTTVYNDINNLFWIGSGSWMYDQSGFYYADINPGGLFTIKPFEAMESGERLAISFIPFILPTFGSTVSKIFFDDFSGTFSLSILKGATNMVFENNISNIEMNQLQVAIIDVTIFTNYAGDTILDNLEANQLLDENFGFSVSGYSYYPSVLQVESISMTYTIWYKDKTNFIDGKIDFELLFTAASNISLSKTLNLSIAGFSSVDSVDLNVFDELNDFPQNISKNSYIYNGETGLLSVEIYPFFSKYSTLEVSYETTSSSSLSLMQISYDVSGSLGEKWNSYDDSGAILQNDGTLIVQKTSGQDTFKINTDNKYSYSKSYFFALLVGTQTPNASQFIITIKVKNSQGETISSNSIVVTSLAEPIISLQFDQKLKGSDNKYYLPYNTTHQLSLNLKNYSGKVDWQISSPSYVLTPVVTESLLPVLHEGNFYLSVFRYNNDENDVNDPYAIGHEFVLSGKVNDGQNEYEYTLTFIISLFTVTQVQVTDVSDGVLTLPSSTTSPLRVDVEAEFDEKVLSTANNWYSIWFNANGNKPSDQLYQKIVASGYEVQQNFQRYINSLKESIAKARSNVSLPTVSGVFYLLSDDNVQSSLTLNTSYNDNTFRVENYKNFFALNGLKVDNASDLRLNLKLSYYGASFSTGLPNVENYNSEVSTAYKHTFTFTSDFSLIFEFKAELINYIPVSNAKEFLDMRPDLDYRLVADIELTAYTPINATFSSFDGNNHKIYITGFSYSANTTSNVLLGLFSNVSTSSIVVNTTVHYTSRVQNVEGLLIANSNPLQIDFYQTQNIIFGGIACENNGVLSNCKVTGGVNISLNIQSSQENAVSVATERNGGLVATNTESGYITNSKVESFVLICYGQTGGFVCQNNGKIVASYFVNSSIGNLSSDNMGGFAYSNSITGSILECYSEGMRTATDRDIRNTGDGLASYGGNIGGFIYSNAGIISDSYSNIKVSSSSSMAGFFYVDTANSVISRCYSISYKNASDNNTTAFPFAGPLSSSYEPRIEVKGRLNNSFYLSSTENWKETDFFIPDSTNAKETPENKKAKGISFDNFATHTAFTNYDLSLIYSIGEYADSTEARPHNYQYVDGYTWVIIEGKPVIVSTLANTVSMKAYTGKIKNYSNAFDYFLSSEQAIIEGAPQQLSATKTKTIFYGEDIFDQSRFEIYSITIDTLLKTLTYEFAARDNLEKLTLYYDISEGKTNAVLISAEKGESDVEILDVETEDEESLTDDDNFRANDTIAISYNDAGEITAIVYKVLQNASYSYTSNVSGKSAVAGSRTNPILISSDTTFSNYLSRNTAQNFYRLICDIDLGGNFVSTAHSSFQGVMQGNYMSVENVSLSYLSSKIEQGFDSQSFGLFASITTVADNALQDSEVIDTVISNLNLKVSQVLSNAHKYVGALAGRIGASVQTITDPITGETTTVETQNAGQKIFLNNIQILGVSDSSGYIQGKNAVGALSGIATGRVIIKDITCDVSVNATFEIPSSFTEELLYTGKDNTNFISYAGGVVGIFDVKNVVDASTQKNYNATNISVLGRNSYSGTIVGSAFGLVGQDAILNYVNTTVQYSEAAYVKAIAYAGGLAGENRGTIISSSIIYQNENENTVRVGYSENTTFNFFYNSSRFTAIAVGGLVGLNNGGTISNSICSINVRNKKATIAGGAVGRMLEGRLENVVASGSVVAKNIMGGLIGTLNDAPTFALAGGYSKNAIIKYNSSNETKQTYAEFLAQPPLEQNEKVTIIKNCVAATNWLFIDYSFYVSIFRNIGAVGGFIGLVALQPETLEVEERMNEIVSFSSLNFYSNTLYSINTSIVDRYLNPVYFAETFDIYNSAVIGDPITLVDENGNQSVFPYATTSFYNEVNLANVFYRVRTETNTLAGTSTEGNMYMSKIYTITSATSASLRNDSQFFSEIGNEWTTLPSERTFDWYKNHFGKFYTKETDESGEILYVLIEDETSLSLVLSENPDEKFYYVSTPIISNFNYSETYYPSANSIAFFGSQPTNQKGSDAHSFTTLSDFKNQTHISLNGLTISLLDATLEMVNPDDEIEEDFSGITYTFSDINLVLPDGRVISKLSFNVTSYMTGSTKWFSAESLTLHYLCENITTQSSSSDDFITLSSSIVNITTTYSLNVTSKKVIYHTFENGYWSFATDFLSSTYSIEDRFPQNKEFADIYVWSSFITPFVGGNEIITEIYSAEDLAALAYSVNVLHHDYNSLKVYLMKDIDLSGKYWVPIGNDQTPFRGTFEGSRISSRYSIKYASVNEKSFANTTPIYAGLFGKIDGALLQNFIVIGGEFKGEVAGGVAAFATNSIISNVENRNAVFGIQVAGGIVGVNYSLSGADESKLSNCSNYGEVKIISTQTHSHPIVFAGGIVGRQNVLTEQDIQNGITLKQSTLSTNQNYGKLNFTNRLTNYTSLSANIVSVFFGGILGKSSFTFFDGENANFGDFNLITNAHELFVGGVAGKIENNTPTEDGIAKLTNDSSIFVSYENAYRDIDLSQALCFVGGVVGQSAENLTQASSDGDIVFSSKRSSLAEISLSGIVAKTSGNVWESYNISNISLTSSDAATTLNVGGLIGLADLQSTIFVTNCYNSGNLTADNTSNIFLGGIVARAISSEEIYSLTISNCLNIGSVSVQSINEAKNAIGAIVAVDDFVFTGFIDENDPAQSVYLRNYYLRSSAFSGNNNYSATTTFDISSASHKPKADISSFCGSKISSDLKDVNLSYVDWDFDEIWIQEFDTWYPTLRQNNVKALWTETRKEVASANKVYTIESAEQLAFIAHQINSGSLVTKNLTFKLKKQIDLANKFWTPIGTQENPFSGTFDGDGYVIKNMTVDGNLLKSNLFGGLFGYVSQATISNFGLEAPIVQNVDYAAGVVYSSDSSTISKVFTEQNGSQDSKIEGTKGAGGIVCLLQNDWRNSSSVSRLQFSYNNVFVSGSFSGTDTQLVGGIVAKMTNSIISNCYNGADGKVSRRQAVSENDGILVIGSVDANCSVLNVFNLSPTVADAANTYNSCTPKLFILNPPDSIKASGSEPLFANLSENGSELADIWTKEYSLHTGDFKNYPSLRGLGQNWKNTESDSLISYSYNLDSPSSITSTKRQISSDVSGMNLANQTLLSFANENMTIAVKKTYLISTPEELSWLATMVNNGSLSTSNSEFMLISDIDLSGRYWTPIGSSSLYSFRGIFNFNGHVITGLRIDTSDLIYGGLFGYTSNAQIINGYIDGAFIKVKSEDVTSKVYVGTLVGFAENTTIKNISVSTNISGSSKAGTYVGGIVGIYIGSTGYKMENVHVNRTGSTVDLGSYEDMVAERVNDALGIIQANTIDILAVCSNGLVYVGGVAGYVSGYEVSGTGYIIQFADNMTNLAGVSTSSSANVYAGGLIGYGNNFSINASSNYGNVKTYSSKFDIVGGIVGYAYKGNISNCFFSSGIVESRQSSGRNVSSENIWSYVGGIVGWLNDGSMQFNVSVGSTRSNAENQDINAGAIIGKAENKVFNLGEVDTENIYKGNNFLFGVGYVDAETCEIYHGDTIEDIFIQDDTLNLLSNEEKFLTKFWTTTALRAKRIFLMTGGNITLKAISPINNLLSNAGDPGLLVSSIGENTVDYELGYYEEGDKIGIAIVRSEEGVLTYSYVEVPLQSPATDTGYDLSSFLSIQDGVDIVMCLVTIVQGE